MSDAENIVCTEGNLQEVKAFLTGMRREFDDAENQRKAAKRAYMEQWNMVEAVYKDCVTILFQKAEMTCSRKISGVESEIKRRCEEGLREYFAELCAFRHLDWLEYDRAGIKVDMASAKAKTPKKLRDQIATFVANVGDSVDQIIRRDNSEEIMVEFRRTLNASEAICIVADRHMRIEEERAAKEARQTALKQ